MQEARARLQALVTEIYDLQCCQSLSAWDQDCHMPKGGAEQRASMAGTIEKEVHRKLTDPRLYEAAAYLVRDAQAAGDQEAVEIGAYWMQSYDEAKKVPESLAAALAEASSKGVSAWGDDVNFNDMLPYLDEMIRLNREYAKCYPEYRPYDALIDCFEPDMTQAHLDNYFGKLRGKLLTLRSQVDGKGSGEDIDPASREQPLIELCRSVTAWMGFDYHRGNLAVTEHPFMVSLSANDVRIATSLRGDDPLFTLMSAIHEAGHGLYEQGVPSRFIGTGLDTLDSSGLHESQSLFWEVMVAKSPEFWQEWLPAMNASLTEPFEDVASVLAKLHRYDDNNVVRLQAGDLDYGLHILLRYDVERALFEDNIPTSEMRDCFNERCKEYFGRYPKNDRREGVLQDVHWPAGMFGYFPSYLLGVSLAAQLWGQFKPQNQNGNLVGRDLAVNALSFVRKNVHDHAGRLNFVELTDGLGGYDPQHYVDYLTSIYVK